MTPAALARIHSAAFRVPRPWSVGEFAALLDEPGVFLVARTTGFALIRVVADEAELLTLAVLPRARLRGLGRALLAAAEARAAAAGAARIFLEVAEDNAPARALYVAAGYAAAGRRPGYFVLPGGESVDALVLHRALPSPAG